MPLDFQRFEFVSASVEQRTVVLRYRLSGGSQPDIGLEERLELPEEIPVPDAADPVVQALLDGIHRAFGVSYYKAALPKEIVASPVSPEDAAFWNTLYTEGMGEFYYRNQIDPRGRVSFPTSAESTTAVVVPPTATETAIVLAGGGKDSAVASELVKSAGIQADALALTAAPWIKRQAEASGLRLLAINRTMDPKLRELNAAGALNGHIPIAACIAFISMLAAYVGKYSWVIVANERSADEGNLEWNGMTINHQWSKSLAFESRFQDWCDRHFTGGPRYFSILRPLGELRIAEFFARHPAYVDSFTSCNKNFKLTPQSEPARWCGHCPKCVFTQLAIMPFVDDATVTRMFGANFLADPTNRTLLEELAGVSGTKPFECVGTPSETRAALATLLKDGRIADADLRAWTEQQILPLVPDLDELWKQVRTPGGPHRLPPVWEQRLYAALST